MNEPSQNPDIGFSKTTSERIHQHLGVLASMRPDGMAGAIAFCRTELSAEYQRMLAAVADTRWPDAARAAHNLGSISALVDIEALHAASRAVEAELRGGDSPRLPALLADTERAFNDALQLLNVPTG